MSVYTATHSFLTLHCAPASLWPSEALPWHPSQGVESLKTQPASLIPESAKLGNRVAAKGQASGAAMHCKYRLSSYWEETWPAAAMTDLQASWQSLIKPDVLCLLPSYSCKNTYTEQCSQVLHQWSGKREGKFCFRSWGSFLEEDEARRSGRACLSERQWQVDSR